MKKILLIMLFFFLGINQSFSARYGNHSVIYDDPGLTNLGGTGGPNMGTFCDDDGNGIFGRAIAENNNSTTLLPHLDNETTNEPSSGTMRCLYWDEELPIISYNLSGGTTNNDTWTNTNVTAAISCSDIGGSGCDLTTYQYRTSTSSFTCNSSGTWISGSSKLFNPGTGTNLIEYICFRAKDEAGNGYEYGNVAIIKIDKVTPSSADISTTTSSQLLATNNQNFTVNALVNGGSPITYISAFFEKYNSINDFNGIEISNSGIWSYNENIENVDNSRSNGYRQYSLRVSKICDEAGNCIGSDVNTSNIGTFVYEVYANTLASAFTIKSATTNLDDTSNIANGVEKNITITLEDTYGNEIVPASGISREIEFDFYYNNFLYSNQYNSTGNGIYSTRANDNNFNNDFNLGLNHLIFANENSSSGNYIYKFKIYSPTYDSLETNGQELVNTNAVFNINNIVVNINGSIGGNLGTTINNSNIDSNFAPIYHTEITGDLITLGIIEGNYQNSDIEIIENLSYPTFNNNLYVEFGSGVNLESTKFDLEIILNSGTGIVKEGYNLLDSDKLFKLNNFSLSNPLLSKVISTGGLWEDIADLYISSHISYEINSPNGIIEIQFNSDVYGKNNYLSGINPVTTYTEGLKVIGKTHSLSQVDLSQDQEESDIHILGDIEKSSLKQEIVKNVYEVVKNLSIDNGVNQEVTDLVNFDNNEGNNQSDNVLYFGELGGTTVFINPTNEIDGQKTIVAIGGNIYIKNNILRNNNDAVLGIIALKDENGMGGNIYIDPDVIIIEGILYADKSLISYNGNELDGNTNAAILSNQLYILGSVFSENTIGGSRDIPTMCPYYVPEISCDLNIAQKFDLNYLRRYYVNPSWSTTSGVYGGINYFLDYDGSGTNYNGGGYSYYNYPVVIKYNPIIQVSPPPFFESN